MERKNSRLRKAQALRISGVALVVLLLLILSVRRGAALRISSPSDLTPTPTSWPRGRMASPEYGLQASLWWDKHAAKRDLGLIHDAGFGWVKQNVGWRDVEGITKGSYDWYFTDRIVKEFWCI